MSKIRFVIVGAGNVAGDHIRGIKSNPDAELVGVCSNNPEKVKALAQQYKVVGATTIPQLLNDVQFDAACICTPQIYRREPCLDLIKAGKHLLVEKPFAASVVVGRELLSAASENGVIIGGVSQRRFFEPVQRMRRAIQLEAIKPVAGNIQIYGHRDRDYYEQLSWRGKRGDGLMFNQTAHQLDILLWLLGEATAVSGMVANHTHAYNEAEDFASALIQFKGGKTANYLATLSVQGEDEQFARIHLIGDNEQIIGVQTDKHMWVAGKSTKPPSRPFNDMWSLSDPAYRPAEEEPHYHTLQIADFVESIRERRTPLVSGAELQRVVELIAGIYLSSLSGERIQLPLSEQHATQFDRWLETGAI